MLVFATSVVTTFLVGGSNKVSTYIVKGRKWHKTERLRADFYEEMVAFGKEVYGIDLKKAGTK